VAVPVLLWRARPGKQLLWVGWLLALATVLVVAAGLDSVSVFVFALATAAVMLPLRWVLVVDGLVALAIAIVCWWVRGTAAPWGALLTVLSVAATASMVGILIQTVSRLRRAQAEIAKLAVAEERARVARELHDVLGHSLTTITVKAGLARRLLETSPERTESAAAEITDVERLARQALTEVRATVSGYRQASLPAEIAGARVALAAAGIEADFPQAVDDVPARYQEAFAYVLREGVTNVLRHSGARRCQVRLGASWLEVRDDGVAAKSTPDGHGLKGLAERLSSLGGRIEVGPVPGGGFRLRASIGEPA
jgi:two-component system sensor histidine kinase DesK